MAKCVFTIFPFKPEVIPENWSAVLGCWLSGKPLASLDNGKTFAMVKFIDDGVIYRLSWAMRSIRIRANIYDQVVDIQGTSDGYDPCPAISAVESGTISRAASILMQAGFNYRTAAIKAVTETNADFHEESQLRKWLKSKAVVAKSEQADWPTKETREMWDKFLDNFLLDDKYVWKKREYMAGVEWNVGTPLQPTTPVHVHHWNDKPHVLSADGAPVGILQKELNSDRSGLLCSDVGENAKQISMTYFGPDDLFDTPRTKKNPAS